MHTISTTDFQETLGDSTAENVCCMQHELREMLTAVIMLPHGTVYRLILELQPRNCVRSAEKRESRQL